MSQPRPYELDLSRKVLRVLMVLNPIFGFLILAMLIASLAPEPFMMRALIHEHGTAHAQDSHALIAGMRWIMALGIVAIMLTQVGLKRLFAIVETVREGDPFVFSMPSESKRSRGRYSASRCCTL